jgi:hypothetical protein
MRGTADLQGQAEKTVRHAAATGLPVSHLDLQKVTRAVEQAYARGHAQAIAEVIDAWQLHILDNDDLDGFVDALKDLAS